MMQLLKESASSRHAERLEQIVIILIAIEIGLSIISSPCSPEPKFLFSPWDYNDPC